MSRVSLSLDAAGPADVGVLLGFIRELAEYERLLDRVTVDEDRLRETLFGPRRCAEALIARWDDEPVGFALWFHNYSTFVGRPGLYLEDVYVRPSMRGRGIGKAILAHLARLAVERGCGRLEWAVLDWNGPAIEFYRALGARPMDDWTVYRLEGRELDDLAARGRRSG